MSKSKLDKLNIEDIKYCVEGFKPEGFRIKHDFVSGEDVLWFDQYCVMFLGRKTPREGLYFLFLQRVIEGINKGGISGKDHSIIIEQYGTQLILDDEAVEGYVIYNFSDHESIDNTKEHVIKDVIKQLRIIK